MYMSQTITIKKSDYQEMRSRIARLEGQVSKLLQIFGPEPEYGSDAWWEWSDTKALKEVQKDAYVSFDSAADMVEYLKNL